MLKSSKRISKPKKESKTNDEYTVLTFISLSPKINTDTVLSQITSPLIHDHDSFTQLGIQHTDTKTKIRYLMYTDSSLNDHDLLFATRSSDIVVFLVSSGDIYEAKLKILKRQLPSFLVCMVDKKEKVWTKKFVKDYLGSAKIVNLDTLFLSLSFIRIENTRLCEKRPYFVPKKYLKNGNEIVVNGYLKKGFVSKFLVCNGLYDFEIKGFSYKDCEYEGSFLDDNDFEIENFKDKNNCQEVDLDMNIEDMDEEQHLVCSSDSMSQDVECVEEEVSELIMEQQAITNEYPIYFNDIVFFNRYNDLVRKISKTKSKLEGGSEITIRFKKNFEGDFNPRFLVFFNKYKFEDLKTVYNVQFNADFELKENLPIRVDIGHQIFNVTPMLSYGNKNSSHIVKKSMKSGVMSFIAPITFNLNKLDIYKTGQFKLFVGDYLGIGSSVVYNDRILLEENVLKGYPQKIDKRYCTVQKMFNSKQEVMYFRNMKIKTKDGNDGIIKKPIGTHGRYKAYFNRPIQHGGIILMSLCRRVYPLDY